MGWTQAQLEKQLAKHPKVNSLVGVNIKSKEQATENVKVEPKYCSPPLSSDVPEPEGAKTTEFTSVGDPMGKPRMTQRDRWMKRDVVLRYRDYCDRLREAAPNGLQTADVYAVDVIAYIAMPESWSKKKKAEMLGSLHRQKPDWDNIGKAVCDALWEDDSMIGDGRTRKFWCNEGEQRTVVRARHF
jgi:Holliday junction resolvase RusA-like endonuclease